MLAVALIAGLWGLGVYFKVPAWQRGFVVVLVLLVAAVVTWAQPVASPFGGTAGGWLVLAAAVAGIFGYRNLLSRLKDRAVKTDPEPTLSDALSPAELDRYARHIVLRELGGAGQQRLKKARVLVVGAGGLGSPALLYLTAAGVGTIGVIDDDTVSHSNLQRQVLFRDADIGLPKVQAAQAALQALNPYVEIRPYQRRLTADIAQDLLADYDLVLDGSDTFATRDVVNRACVATKTPLISGAIAQWEGQVSLFAPSLDAPCYACMFPAEPADGLAPSCAEAGVIGALPGIIGAMMATEAIKFISGAGTPLLGEMLIHDALYGESRKIKIERRADCAVCGT